MGILKDWREETNGYTLQTKVTDFFSPKVWLRLHKWRVQRADRGWSDRDMWSAGEHIARMTAEMLEELSKGNTDWDWWFKNTNRKEKYDNLEDVVSDIKEYLKYESNQSWADGLEYRDDKWVDPETGRSLTDKQISTRIIKHHKQRVKLYRKSTRAMEFFGRNFEAFWD